LEELGIVKHNGHYTVPRANGAAAKGLLSLDLSGENLVVAHTEPGLASAVAVDIDGAAIPEIVGTLAGEDTIFIAVVDAKGQRAVLRKVWELFG
jgi:transcriptional regulator of arginine metabolism